MNIFKLNIFKDVDVESLSKEEILDLYKSLNEFNVYVYDFVLTYYNYIYKTKDYGTGLFLSMLEAHVITDIADNPGISATEIAKKWDRTPAAISQIIRKLEAEKILTRKLNDKNRKYYNLFLTQKGKDFDFAHKKYDVNSIITTNKELLKTFTAEEIEISRKVMREYGKIIDAE